MRQFETDTTICAIASGLTSAERGIIRVSGPKAIEVCSRLLLEDGRSQLTSGKRAERLEGSIQVTRFDQRIPASLFLWPDKRSYTGQSSVEIHTIGNQLLLELIVEQLLSAGAKSAQPGEFTYRAFLNGRLDLTQCEAVLAVINATQEKALDVSLRQLAGGLSEPLTIIRQDLIELLADLEAGLDFVEEDIQFVSSEDIQRRLGDAQSILNRVIQQLGTRRVTSHARRVVLLGLPNAGKSSLANALTGHDIAIVSDQAGTTRDFVRTVLTIGSSCIELIDTAGIEGEDACTSVDMASSSNSIQTKAQSSTFQSGLDADLILLCRDGQLPQTDIEVDYLKHISAANEGHESDMWLVQTKCDLAKSTHSTDSNTFQQIHRVSALSGEGIKGLLGAIESWLSSSGAPPSEVVPMTLVRCAESVNNADVAISAALRIASDSNGQEELIAAELRTALHELGVVVGEVYTDDILDALFSRFCIGK